MVDLAANVSSSDTTWTLSAALNASPGDCFQVDDEIVEFGSYVRGSTPGDYPRNVIGVQRGFGGSVAASHLSGATLTQVRPAFSDAVPPVGGGGGGATSTVSDTDPGAIGAGNLWIRLNAEQSYPPTLYVRNQTDDGWVDGDGSGNLMGLTYYDDSDTLRSFIVGDDSGSVSMEVHNAGGNMVAQFFLSEADGGIQTATTFAITATGVIINTLPTADPVVAGALWIDVAGGRVVKVSAG